MYINVHFCTLYHLITEKNNSYKSKTVYNESMWREIATYFTNYPAQQKIAQKIIEYGLRIKNNKLYCGDIELSDTKVARALHLDRRAITTTINSIMKNQELMKIFSQLKPTCHLKDVAPFMNWGVIEIIPNDPSTPGILAEVSTIIAQNNISIRQAIGDDFELTEAPRLFIVTEKPIPGSLIPKLRQAKGVKAVMIY